MWSYIVMFVLAILGLLLMFIILLQRGRGGGLAGAFGGMGGQSAFGTRAGDVFTKITVVLAVIWVVLAAASGFVLRWEADRGGYQGSQTTAEGSEDKEDSADGDETELPPAASEKSGDPTASKKGSAASGLDAPGSVAPESGGAAKAKASPPDETDADQP